MPFFFAKRRSPAAGASEGAASVAQLLQTPQSGQMTAGRGRAVDTFEVELLSHLDTLYSVSCRMTKSSVEAEDLVQDTIVKAMRARAQYQPGTNIKAWLLRILTNTFINRYRRGGLERDVLEGPDADPLTDGWVGATTMRAMRDPETQALKPIIEAEVSRALEALPEDFRLAVVLSDIEELSYKEIAEAMGCPIGTVMSRLHRGRKLLQKTLRDHAVALGIVPDLPDEQHDAVPAQAARPLSEAPLDLAAYRNKKRAVG
jgi:RNA polymerase sigma-70 factor, ECF subfamily